MLKVYTKINFKDFEKDARKHYFDIEYDKGNKRDMKQLNVFLIPHSHDDPGWLKTFEGYYNEDVSVILNGMLDYLNEDNQMKFVYVEMSFFELFYSTLNLERREKVRKLLEQNKLEIITGGWVMSDEANSHFVSQIIELFEGHEFVKNQLNYIPKNHWSIDPFGLSPTMAYLIKQCGFEHMAIQRVHYMVKQYFAQRKLFEFQWRQLWSGGYKDGEHDTDIFTHMFPYGSYTSGETCGPDKFLCEEINQKIFSGYKVHLKKNDKKSIIKEDAKLLADQYRKKSLLFRGSNIFIPIGTDFSYNTLEQWPNVHDNYNLIINEINNNKDLKMKVQFATLNDYFAANDKDITKDKIDVPVVTGDFFTYADRDEEYWSGYYTSRPFYKRLDRVLMDTLRSAEIIFASVLSKIQKNEQNYFLKTVDYNKLVYARRALSLFQHHDGVTGTSRIAVVVDYGKKLFKALQNCYEIIEKSIQYDITGSTVNGEGISVLKKVNDYDKMPRVKALNVDKNIIIFNPLSRDVEKELICTKVEGEKLFIIDGIDIKDQEIHPSTQRDKDGLLKITSRSYRLCYILSIKAFDIKILKLVAPQRTPKIAEIYTSEYKIETNQIFTKYAPASTITVDNTLSLSKLHGVSIDSTTGYIKTIKNIPVSVGFEYYNMSTTHPNSGAYLFTPAGPSSPIEAMNNSFIISKGDLYQKAIVVGPGIIKLVHTIECKVTSPEYVDVTNIVDITDTSNFEVAMKLKANGKEQMIKNGNVFYSDLNGYQIIKRKRLDALPIQGNFYPMPSTIFIQDDYQRLTVLSNQPLGCSSQEEGSVEIMMDRRLLYDDHRGLGHGVMDNIPTRSKFRILLENRKKKLVRIDSKEEVNEESSVTGYLSPKALMASQSLINNLIQMEADKTVFDEGHTFSILKNQIPSNIHVAYLRTLSDIVNYGDGGVPDNEYNRNRHTPTRSAALILQNMGFDGSVGIGGTDNFDTTNGEINVNDYMIDNLIQWYKEGSLTLLYDSERQTTDGNVLIRPMELKTLKLQFK
uniref:Alpha-mannosidase n=1 Tax=Parastrongyloides trichosuri TaxID=131310 RepID=A0A0N4ZVU2_PARTI